MSESQSNPLPPTIDASASARWLRRSQGVWLHEEIGHRMQERLQWMRVAPQTWLDWCALHGGLQTHAKVRARYPEALVYLHEQDEVRRAAAIRRLRAPWWQRWLGWDRLRTEAHPPAQMQMVGANMMLHQSPDPQALLKQWQQALDSDGFLMFSCLGPDTLRELLLIYQDKGWPPPCHVFTDMHDWGDMLVQSGFAEPVMDMERLTLTYATAEGILQDLRRMGRNLHRERFAALRGRGWLERLKVALNTLASTSKDGRIHLTIEVIYGHALKASPRVSVAQTTTVSLQDMRTLLKTQST